MTTNQIITRNNRMNAIKEEIASLEMEYSENENDATLEKIDNLTNEYKTLWAEHSAEYAEYQRSQNDAGWIGQP